MLGGNVGRCCQDNGIKGFALTIDNRDLPLAIDLGDFVR